MRGQRKFFLLAVLCSFLFLSVLAWAASIEIQQITVTTLCENFQPSISGDGKRVVFLSDCDIIPGMNKDQNYEIFLYDTETKRFVQITDTTATAKNNVPENNQPTINQDGSLVAFRSSLDIIHGQNADGNPEIFLYDTKTKSLAQLTHTPPPVINTGPSLSGDGERLVLLSSVDLSPGENREGKTEIFLFEKKTGKFTQLTHIPSSLSGKENVPPVVHSSAVISRDGTKVVIASTADLVKGENNDGGSQFFIYDLTKKNITQLTHMKGNPGTMSHQHGPPALNDKATRLAFLSMSGLDHSDHEEGQPAIFLLDLSTQSITPLVKAPNCLLHNPTMNGDGTKVAFSSTCDFIGENNDPGVKNEEIFLYNTTTKTITQLTHTLRDFNHSPSIDRSGARIAFGSDRDIHRGSNLDENSEIFLAILP
jgi:Tol biopolymer transport system component